MAEEIEKQPVEETKAQEKKNEDVEGTTQEEKPKVLPEQEALDAAKAELETVKENVNLVQEEKAQLEAKLKEAEEQIESLKEQQKEAEKKVLDAKDNLRRAKFKGGGMKKFQASTKGAVKCPVCEKRVYPTEKALDSKESVYHKLCLRCEVCKQSLVGKEPIMDDKQWKLLPAQYRIKVEDDKTHLFCNTHGEIKAAQVAKVQTQEEKQAAKAKEMATMKRATFLEKKKVTAQRMEKELGEVPTDFEDGKRLPVRTLVKKAADRMIIQVHITEDKNRQKPFTFMLDLNDQEKDKALLLKKFEPCRLRYHVDTSAMVERIRIFTVKFEEGEKPQFGMTLREGSAFTSKHPSGEDYVPAINVKKRGVHFIKSKVFFFELTHDGLLKYGGKQDKLGKSLVLNENFKFELAPPDNATMNIIDGGGKVVLSVTTDHENIARDWIESFEDVLKSSEEFKGFDRTSLYLFSVEGGVLQTIETVLAVNLKSNQIACVDSNIHFTPYPPITLEEMEKLNPLKSLQEQITMKRRIIEVGEEKAAKMKEQEDKVAAKERAKQAKAQAKAQAKREKAKKKKGA